MKATGIVRRIDELGRVVIPKEIRRTLRIKEGDPLEIYTDREDLLFRKYSPIATLEKFSQSCAEALEEVMGNTVLITDNDNVLMGAGSGKKEFIGGTISEELENLLKERKSVIRNRLNGEPLVQIVKGTAMAFECQVITPVILGGDCLGCIIMLSKQNIKFGEGELKNLQVSAAFLARQFE